LIEFNYFHQFHAIQLKTIIFEYSPKSQKFPSPFLGKFVRDVSFRICIKFRGIMYPKENLFHEISKILLKPLSQSIKI
jgi:hypothetical protein